MLRRVLFAFVTIFAGAFSGAIALILNVYLSYLYISYLAGLRPHENKKDDKLELISELLLLYCFFGIIFAEIEDNPVSKYSLGWYSVICVCILVGVQVLNMMLEGLISLIKSLRQQWIKIKAKCAKKRPEPSLNASIDND